jgi:hypothetical protein
MTEGIGEHAAAITIGGCINCCCNAGEQKIQIISWSKAEFELESK